MGDMQGSIRHNKRPKKQIFKSWRTSKREYKDIGGDHLKPNAQQRLDFRLRLKDEIRQKRIKGALVLLVSLILTVLFFVEFNAIFHFLGSLWG